MTMSHPLLPLDVQQRYRELGLWEGLTLADAVGDWAERDPERPAVVGPTRLSYGEVWERARRLAGALRVGGLRHGDYVLAVQPTSWQGIVLEVAASILGAPLAARSNNMSPALMHNLVDQLGVRGLVLQADVLAEPEWRGVLDELRARLEGGPVMLQGFPPPDVDTGDLPLLEDAVATGPLADPEHVDPCAPCIVLSTGGTTGVPKSILHCNEALVYAVRRFAAATGFTEADTHVAFMPYGHAGGSVFEVYMPLLHGAKILPIARWRPRPVAEAIAAYGGTFFITMGTHIFDLLALEPDAAPLLRSVRVAATGAGPDSLFEQGERRLGMKLLRVYGCSECPGHAIGRLDDPPEVRLRQDGVPFPGLEIRIADPHGNPVPDGTPGDYQVRGPNLFMGYAGQPELTAEAVTEDGFYRSGDLLVRSPQGYLNWSGRTKDIIRRGGLQIDPVEMENLLADHPAVSTVVVVGEPDERLGERAVVVAVASGAHEAPTLEDLCAHLLKHGLPKQNLPERLVLTTEIPRTELGKFHRVEIKRRLVEEPERLSPA
jgi:acyl-coenzyme A synthetase/AMP-(fatty) acid ligase